MNCEDREGEYRQSIYLLNWCSCRMLVACGHASPSKRKRAGHINHVLPCQETASCLC
jgi:hypothetical protein